MHFIDGKSLAARIRIEVKDEIAKLGLNPKLAVLLVGDNPASHLYVTLKRKAAEEAGILFELAERPAETPDDELIALIGRWNADVNINAILVQLPLPPEHDEDRVVVAIADKKDVDGFHPRTTVIPPVHEGILRLINETPVVLHAARAALITNSEIFTAPLERLLKTAGVFVTTMRPDSMNERVLSEADIVVIAVGRAGFLTSAMVNCRAVIIDVGTNKLPDGRTVGDVDASSFQNTDVWLSPVPGGVGPMTVALLLKNVVQLSKPSPSDR